LLEYLFTERGCLVYVDRREPTLDSLLFTIAVHVHVESLVPDIVAVVVIRLVVEACNLSPITATSTVRSNAHVVFELDDELRNVTSTIRVNFAPNPDVRPI